MQILRSAHKGYMVCLRLACALCLIFAFSPTGWTQTKPPAVSEPPAVLKPVVAGLFYPADKRILEQKINGYLKEAAGKVQKGSASPFGLISPHAGYDYSGRVAAVAYRQIQGKPYRTVFLLAATHYVPFQGVSIYPSGAYETPLGKIPVDDETSAVIMQRCGFARFYSPAFEREHSLEVQLPFLQKTLESFKVVPMVMGRVGESEYRLLAETLTTFVQKNPGRSLIIASSDMSHFHPYQEASAMDRATLGQIESADLKNLTRNIERGTCELCGVQPVLTLMKVAENLAGKIRVLDYANSGDVTGDKSRVVGYGAVAFYPPDERASLGEKEQKALLQVARRTLEAHVTGRPVPRPHAGSEKLLQKRGLFVTLEKRGELRGCIGYIKPVLPLADAVAEMTVSASSRDPRFPPVTQQELADIHIEISVLSPMRRIDDTRDVRVGLDGLFIVKGGASGLLLPQVATQQRWDKEEFLRQTCIKAGLPPNAWREKETETYAFTAQIFSE